VSTTGAAVSSISRGRKRDRRRRGCSTASFSTTRASRRATASLRPCAPWSRLDRAYARAVEPVLLNVADYERAAAGRLGDGPYGYFAGGANDELTLEDNVAAYRHWVLRPRVLVDVSAASTATTVLGHELAMPVLVAPVAFQRAAHPDGEV